MGAGTPSTEAAAPAHVAPRVDVKLCVEQMEGVLAKRELLIGSPGVTCSAGESVPTPTPPANPLGKVLGGVAQRPAMKFKAVPTPTLYRAQSTGTFGLQLPGMPGPGKAKQLVPSIPVRQ